MLHHLLCHSALLIICSLLHKPERAEDPSLLGKVALEGMNHIDMMAAQVATLYVDLALHELTLLHQLQAAHWKQT